MVSKCLQLTVIAVFEVMGTALVQVKYNALPTLGISVFNPPAVCVHFLLLQLKNQSIQSQNVVHSSPVPSPVTMFPASPEEHVTMVTSPSDAQTKSTSLVRLPSRQNGIRDLDGATRSHKSHSPMSLSRVSQYQIQDNSLVLKGSEKEIQECPSNLVNAHQSLLAVLSQHFS